MFEGWYLVVFLSDGSSWGVPASMVARRHALENAHLFDGDAAASLNEGTLNLFSKDRHQMVSWAQENMRWDDFRGHYVQLRPALGRANGYGFSLRPGGAMQELASQWKTASIELALLEKPKDDTFNFF